MMFRIRRWLILSLAIVIFSMAAPVWAHASLSRSTPVDNEVLASAPSEIRLWFTETLEPSFSHFYLQDIEGQRLPLPESTIAETDSRQMVVALNETLPDGVYTVVWRVLSSADTHPTTGSFAFVVGDNIAGLQSASTPQEILPAERGVIRWLNLLSLALLGGGLGFYLLVWLPIKGDSDEKAVEQRVLRVIYVGWGAVGLTTLLLLILQLSVATDAPLFQGINGDIINELLYKTRFGQNWLLRAAVWFFLSTCLFLADYARPFYWVALVLSGVIMMTNSLLSHAAAAYDENLAIASDALHLMATSAWVGGLICFVLIIPLLLRSSTQGSLARLTAQFSNFARLAVIALIVTGVYATWLQVGSLEALVTTLYGQLLMIKLILFLPVMMLAGVNLFFTQRHLRSGATNWGNRLRILVGAEVLLTVIVLIVVGMMTSVSPARNTWAVQANKPLPPEPSPIVQTELANNLEMQLEVSPGWVGPNTFTLRVIDDNGVAIVDASRIRMRFQSQEQSVGESELRLEHAGDGVYQAQGLNLNAPGDWRIRVNVQRPDQFDTVVDFTPRLSAAPPPQTRPLALDNSAPVSGRLTIYPVIGIALLVLGISFLVFQERPLRLRWNSLFGAALIFWGFGFLLPLPVGETHEIIQPRDLSATVSSLLPLSDQSGFSVYWRLENPTTQDESLIGIVSSQGTIEIVTRDGTQDLSLDVPAGGTLYFVPGADQMFLYDVTAETITQTTLTLSFASGRQLTVPIGQ